MSEAAKALVEAQREMGRAFKGKSNPAFRSKYADLGAVMDAAFPALQAHGFAVIQPQGRDEHGDYVETVFVHETGESFASRVYLLIDKPTMQGKGSAITYARRYGLIALAGIADTDDDGAAASEPAGQAGQRRDTSRPSRTEPSDADKLRAKARDLYEILKASDPSDRPEILAVNDDLMGAIRRNIPDAANHIDKLMGAAA